MNFARFVVRPGVNGGMIGINSGLFREGVVYEVAEVLGEFVIREVGDSPLGLPDVMARERFGFCNGWTWNHLYTTCGGNVVRTINELASLSGCVRCGERDPVKVKGWCYVGDKRWPNHDWQRRK